MKPAVTTAVITSPATESPRRLNRGASPPTTPPNTVAITTRANSLSREPPASAQLRLSPPMTPRSSAAIVNRMNRNDVAKNSPGTIKNSVPTKTDTETTVPPTNTANVVRPSRRVASAGIVDISSSGCTIARAITAKNAAEQTSNTQNSANATVPETGRTRPALGPSCVPESAGRSDATAVLIVACVPSWTIRNPTNNSPPVFVSVRRSPSLTARLRWRAIRGRLSHGRYTPRADFPARNTAGVANVGSDPAGFAPRRLTTAARVVCAVATRRNLSEFTRHTHA